MLGCRLLASQALLWPHQPPLVGDQSTCLHVGDWSTLQVTGEHRCLYCLTAADMPVTDGDRGEGGKECSPMPSSQSGVAQLLSCAQQSSAAWGAQWVVCRNNLNLLALASGRSLHNTSAPSPHQGQTFVLFATELTYTTTSRNPGRFDQVCLELIECLSLAQVTDHRKSSMVQRNTAEEAAESTSQGQQTQLAEKLVTEKSRPIKREEGQSHLLCVEKNQDCSLPLSFPPPFLILCIKLLYSFLFRTPALCKAIHSICHYAFLNQLLFKAPPCPAF